MNDTLILLVIGMAIVTYIPRVLPMVYLRNIRLPRFMKRFLEFVPYTVLASLIFPGILYSVENMYSAIIGGILSIGLSLFKVNLTLVVLGGIIGVLLSEQLIVLMNL